MSRSVARPKTDTDPADGEPHLLPDRFLPIGELRRRGKALRGTTPRRAHAELTLPVRDPIAILAEQNSTRLPDLVPIRTGRMLQSPFAFYRGTAALMAHDLAAAQVTGLQVLCCGDAHISNFGLFASPERRVMFDLNDFDEASNAPWEWDVKRLAASVVVGGRDNGIPEADCHEIAETAVRTYRLTLHEMYALTALERFYFQIDADWLEMVGANQSKKVRQTVRKARRRTSDQVLSKITTTGENGTPRIVDIPPLTRHVDIGLDRLATLLERYRNTLRADTAFLLSQFQVVDYVLRVVGVGSVGTRCYVGLLLGPADEPLFLQVKESQPSVLEAYGGHRSHLDRLLPVEYGHQGYRVVASQRILQAQSDPFLGWVDGLTQNNGAPPPDYYWRQFRDMKGSVETSELSRPEFRSYVALCARLLARAHSQSRGGAEISEYLGDSDRFDKAVAGWAVAYADQTERDFATLERAVHTGRIPVERGV